MKICSDCKIEKPTNDFNKKGKGLQPYCRDCQKVRYKKYYDDGNEKARVKASNQAIREKIKQIIIEKKSVPCADCGVSYPPYVMDFDHQRDKKYNVAAMGKNLSISKLLEEIEKCEVVCANCHRIRTHS